MANAIILFNIDSNSLLLGINLCSGMFVKPNNPLLSEVSEISIKYQ